MAAPVAATVTSLFSLPLDPVTLGYRRHPVPSAENAGSAESPSLFFFFFFFFFFFLCDFFWNRPANSISVRTRFSFQLHDGGAVDFFSSVFFRVFSTPFRLFFLVAGISF